MTYDPRDPDTDPFRPPAIPTLVGCLHCQQEYDSYLIEWRVLKDTAGKLHGLWCCPITSCDGKGFGCDIFPVDPEYDDGKLRWIHDEDEADGDTTAVDNEPGADCDFRGGLMDDDDIDVPW
jgi:hypothetical protein